MMLTNIVIFDNMKMQNSHENKYVKSYWAENLFLNKHVCADPTISELQKSNFRFHNN